MSSNVFCPSLLHSLTVRWFIGTIVHEPLQKTVMLRQQSQYSSDVLDRTEKEYLC